MNLLDLAYVVIILGSMTSLAFLWSALPWLLGEDLTRDDEPIAAPPRSARASSARLDRAHQQP